MYTVLILTHLDKKTQQPLLPHMEWIQKTNPHVNIEIIVGEDSPYGREYNWKNGDQPLRKWWKENGHRIASEIIYIVEWDTFIGCDLPLLPDHLDLVGKQVIRENPSLRGSWKIKPMKYAKWTDENWYWWPDIPKLALKEGETALGLISFGFFIARRWVLESLCNEKWDSIYEKSIQNELRFPTVAHLVGARIGEMDLPFVDHGHMKYQHTPGIYHPIKKAFTFHNENNTYVFYHLLCENDYLFRFQRTLDKMIQSGLHDKVKKIIVNCVGYSNKEDILQEFQTLSPKILILFGMNSNNESETINTIRNFAKKYQNGNILYLHAKGVTRSFDEKGVQAQNYDAIFDWIDMMEFFLIENYSTCLHYLSRGFDTCGSNKKTFPYYSGNFWWARMEYLAQCDICEDDYFGSEKWLLSQKIPHKKIKNFYNCHLTWEDWKKGIKRLPRSEYENVLSSSIIMFFKNFMNRYSLRQLFSYGSVANFIKKHIKKEL